MTKPITRNCAINKRNRLACAASWLLLISGCQSYPTPPPRVVAVRVPTTAGTCGVVHGGARAELDPAAAQRIVGITGDGDQGLIALAACQSYVKDIVSTK